MNNYDFTPYLGNSTEKPQTPPIQYQALHEKYFPNEATPSALAAYKESSYNPQAINENKKGQLRGTKDYGYFQINAGQPKDKTKKSTFQDLWERYPQKMAQIGVYSPEDLLDVNKNFQVASLIKEDEKLAGQKPWSRWYGWQNAGYSMTPSFPQTTTPQSPQLAPTPVQYQNAQQISPLVSTIIGAIGNLLGKQELISPVGGNRPVNQSSLVSPLPSNSVRLTK